MFNFPTKFGEASSGIGAFNINLKGLAFQFVTFVIVLLVFKRWVIPPIQKTLEERRKTLEKGLTDAKATEEALALAETRAEEIIARARAQADVALAEAKKAGAGVVADAEAAAAERATLIIRDAEARLAQEQAKLHQQLRGELAGLVAKATEKIIHEKLDSERDRTLIEQSLRGLS